MPDDVAELNRLAASLAAQLSSARGWLDLARRALLASGYFTDADIGPDIAPRITEYVAATDALLAATVEQRDALRAERDAERAKVQAVEADNAKLRAEADRLTQAIEAGMQAVATLADGATDQAFAGAWLVADAMDAVLPGVMDEPLGHLLGRKPAALAAAQPLPSDTTRPRCYCKPGQPLPACQGRPETWLCHPDAAAQPTGKTP